MKASRWIAGPVLAALVAACGGDETGSSAAAASVVAGAAGATGEFCATARARVDEFMATYRAEHPAPSDERYGGTLVIGTIGDMGDGMNALVSSDYTSSQHQSFVNLMTLIDYDERFQARPYLAESWEVSEDNTELTFHLRRDVLWHDGEPTDAHDVAFTYIRATDPLTAFPNAAFWTHYVKGEAGVEVVDDYTVTIRLEPHSEFLDAWRTVGIMPQHLLADVPPEQLKQHPFGTQCPVGNGPFVFREHLPQDRWVFEANPAFPGSLGGRPYLDRYVLRVIPEQTTLLTELPHGEHRRFHRSSAGPGSAHHRQPRPGSAALPTTLLCSGGLELAPTSTRRSARAPCDHDGDQPTGDRGRAPGGLRNGGQFGRAAVPFRIRSGRGSKPRLRSGRRHAALG